MQPLCSNASPDKGHLTFNHSTLLLSAMQMRKAAFKFMHLNLNVSCSKSSLFIEIEIEIEIDGGGTSCINTWS